MIGVAILVSLCLLAVGLVYGYVRYRASQLKTAKCPSCVVATGVTSGGLKPMNILLIGSNTRTGLDPGEAAQFGSSAQVPGARSDVTMILHLDPATGGASLLSIPRDLFVPLPAHSMSGTVGKIDAALNDGPDNLIAAITQDLGIPINHYIEINFDGFRRSIDAMGGISMSFPTPLRDTYSGLNVTRIGCQTINGTTALAVVRARHLEYYSGGRWILDPLSDLARIRRDHTFLRIFVTTAKSQVSNPFRLNALIGALLNQVTVDSGMDLGMFLDLFRRFRHLDPNTVPETTLPITVVPNYHYGAGAYGDVDMPVEPLDQQIIDSWAGQSLVGVTTPPPVRVVNISGVSHAASDVASGLAILGYPIAGHVDRRGPGVDDRDGHPLPARLGLLGRRPPRPPDRRGDDGAGSDDHRRQPHPRCRFRRLRDQPVGADRTRADGRPTGLVARADDLDPDCAAPDAQLGPGPTPAVRPHGLRVGARRTREHPGPPTGPPPTGAPGPSYGSAAHGSTRALLRVRRPLRARRRRDAVRRRDHDDHALGVVHGGRTDRSEQGTGETTTAPTPDDEQVRVARGLDEGPGRGPGHDATGHLASALPGEGHLLLEHGFGRLDHRVDRRGGDGEPDVVGADQQASPGAQRRLPQRPVERASRVRGPVDADDDQAPTLAHLHLDAAITSRPGHPTERWSWDRRARRRGRPAAVRPGRPPPPRSGRG